MCVPESTRSLTERDQSGEVLRRCDYEWEVTPVCLGILVQYEKERLDKEEDTKEKSRGG